METLSYGGVGWWLDLRRGRWIAGLLVAVTACSGHANRAPLSSAGATTTAVGFRPVAIGQQASVDDWRVSARGFHTVSGSLHGVAPLTASHWLVVDLRITNAGRVARPFFAPDQVALVYLTPALETSGAKGARDCLTGFCERSPDIGGDASPLQSMESVVETFGFLVPERANGFRVVIRASLYKQTQLSQAQTINLSCC